MSDIGLPPDDVPLALFTFNVGVEIGQVAFIGVVVATIALTTRIALVMALERVALRAAPFVIGTFGRVLALRARLAVGRRASASRRVLDCGRVCETSCLT